MRLLLQEKDEPVQLNHWISAELEQDDKILLLRLPSTGGQQIYPTLAPTGPESTAAVHGLQCQSSGR